MTNLQIIQQFRIESRELREGFEKCADAQQLKRDAVRLAKLLESFIEAQIGFEMKRMQFDKSQRETVDGLQKRATLVSREEIRALDIEAKKSLAFAAEMGVSKADALRAKSRLDRLSQMAIALNDEAAELRGKISVGPST